MKRILPLIALIIGAFAMTSCHQEQTDYYTTAQLTLTVPDSISVRQIQGTMTLQSLNTTLSQSSSSITDYSFSMQVLRGAYKVDVVGMIQYTTPNGGLQTRHYRAHSDYTPFADMPLSAATLPIILLDE